MASKKKVEKARSPELVVLSPKNEEKTGKFEPRIQAHTTISPLSFPKLLRRHSREGGDMEPLL